MCVKKSHSGLQASQGGQGSSLVLKIIEEKNAAFK